MKRERPLARVRAQFAKKNASERALNFEKRDIELIMPTATQHANLFFCHFINQTMFVINAFKPTSSEVVFERFGLADATKRISLAFLNQTQQAQRHFAVEVHPPRQVLEPLRTKFQVSHGRPPMRCLPRCFTPRASLLSSLDCRANTLFLAPIPLLFVAFIPTDPRTRLRATARWLLRFV